VHRWGAFLFFIFFYFLHTNFDFAARCAQLRSIGRLDDLAVDVESLDCLV
jgi:hypothetical protein